MSERLYALLLHLYPTQFQARYADEAMELFRDRSRAETGPLRRLRLWFDLARDLILSLLQIHWQSHPAIPHPAAQALHGLPGFQVLPTIVPRRSSFAWATTASILMFGSLFLWMGHGRNQRMSILMAYHAPQKTHFHPSAFHPSPVPAAEAPYPTPSNAFAPVPANQAVASPQPGKPNVENATKAMIQAIGTHQVVMFGETHGNKQEYEWLCDLVKTPAFADRVDDIVIEFGNSLYQKSIDQYISGQNIPIEQAQKAWRNVIGAVGPVPPVYAWFYKAVRESNLQRRGGHKIRLLLGDPYGDWEKIRNAEDLGPYVAHRDEWYAQVVKDEVLAPHHHALLIMGAGHFLRRHGPGLVEQAIRAAGVRPYLVVLGTNAVGGYDDLEPRFNAWPLPAIVDLSGNWVGDLSAMPVVTGGVVAPNSLRMADVADALLYVGARDSLTAVNIPASELTDTDYGREVLRRLAIETGQGMSFAERAETPQFQKPAQQSISQGIHRAPPNPPKSINDPLPPRPPSQ